MRVLLDEDMPRQLKRELVGHDTSTVREMGWNGIKNGTLLRLASSARFEVFLTLDRNIPYQQNVPAPGLAIVVLTVPNSRLATVRSMVPNILSTLAVDLRPGTVTFVRSRPVG